jgi:hypothetical protein
VLTEILLGRGQVMDARALQETPMSQAHRRFLDRRHRRNASPRQRAGTALVRLAPVNAGVAACRILRGRGNVVSVGWYLFTSPDQFQACVASDELRFSDPLQVCRLRAEFDVVFAARAASAPEDTNGRLP